MNILDEISDSLVDRRDSIIQRIIAKTVLVDTGYKIDGKPSLCFNWTGNTSGTGRGGGYGRCSVNGETAATHRVAYTHFFGFIPNRKQIDHLCNNRLCWNPQHLELVSHLTNQKRRVLRMKSYE